MVASARGPRPDPAWRRTAPLSTAVDAHDPRITNPLGFSRSVAGSRPLTARIGGAREFAPEAVGLVHMPSRPGQPVSFAPEIGALDPEQLESMLPLRMRARRLPTASADPSPPVDLVHAAPPVDGDDDDGGFWFGEGDDPHPLTPAPPAIDAPPELVPPDRMRVFRPRRRGLGDPLPQGTHPGERRAEPSQEAPEPEQTNEAQRAFNEAVDAAIREESVRAAQSEPVPSDLRSTLSTAFGVDVGSRPVHRGPDVTYRARGMGARAFTHEGDVFVSDDVGALTQQEARATIAHELTHVAQQHNLGTALPDEGTVAGRRLEAAARSVEDFVRGTPDTPRPSPDLLHPDRVPRAQADVLAPEDYVRQVADELISRGLAYRDGAGELIVGPSPTSSLSPSGVQRQPAATTAADPHASHGFFDNIGRELQHMVLDEWHLSPEDQHNIELNQEVDDRARLHMNEQNEAIDRANAQLTPGATATPHVTTLTDEQRAQIRTQVEHDFQAQNRGAHAPGAGTGTGTGAGAHPTGTGTGTGTGAGTGTGTGAGATQAHGVHSGSDFGGQLRRDLGGVAAGIWGVDAALFNGHDAQHPAAGAATTPTGGAHPGPAGAAAGAGTAGARDDAAPAGAAQHAGAAAGADHAAAGAHGAAGHDFGNLEDHDVEELVRRVYARLRTTLRTELLVDRERAGMLADFR